MLASGWKYCANSSVVGEEPFKFYSPSSNKGSLWPLVELKLWIPELRVTDFDPTLPAQPQQTALSLGRQ